MWQGQSFSDTGWMAPACTVLYQIVFSDQCLQCTGRVTNGWHEVFYSNFGRYTTGRVIGKDSYICFHNIKPWLLLILEYCFKGKNMKAEKRESSLPQIIKKARLIALIESFEIKVYDLLKLRTFLCIWMCANLLCTI